MKLFYRSVFVIIFSFFIFNCTLDNLPVKEKSQINIKFNGQAINNGYTIELGDISTNDKKEYIIIIENKGNTNLSLSGNPYINLIDNKELSIIQPSTSSIVAGGNITFSIILQSILIGEKTTKISIQNNDPQNSNFEFYIRYNSLKPIIQIIDNSFEIKNYSDIDFGEIDKTTFKQKNFIIENRGNADLILSGNNPVKLIYSDNTNDFVITQPEKKILSKDMTTDFTITSRSNIEGIKNAEISIGSNDIDFPEIVLYLKSTITSKPLIEIYENNINVGINTDFNFNEIILGMESDEKIFTIKNNGSKNLVLLGTPIININGINKDDFIITNPTETDILPKSSAFFKIKFKPLTIGEKQATISILSNDSSNSTFSFYLKSNSNKPIINIIENSKYLSNYSEIDFGEIDITDFILKKIIIENKGDSDLILTGNYPVELINSDNTNDFIITQPEKKILSKDMTTDFTITSRSNIEGIKNAKIRINSNDFEVSEFILFLKSKITSKSSIEVIENNVSINNESNFAFYDTTLGYESDEKIFIIKNNGSKDLILTGSPIINISGINKDEFIVTNPSDTTILPKSSAFFKIKFSPTSIGDKLATISILNNDPDKSTFTINLKAKSIMSELKLINGIDNIQYNDVINIGNCIVGNSKTITLTIKNNSSGLLSLTGLLPISIISDATNDFIFTQPVIRDLTYDSSTSFDITFKPTSIGTKNATFKIKSNDFNYNEFIFKLSGDGVISPEMTVKFNNNIISNNQEVDIGKAFVNTESKEMKFYLENTGTDKLILTGAPIVNKSGINSNEFALFQPSVNELLPKESAFFIIKFYPTSEGVKSVTINILNNSSDYNFIFTIKASCSTEPNIKLTCGTTEIVNGDSYNFGVVEKGIKKTVTFTIENNGSQILTLTNTPYITKTGSIDFGVNQPTASSLNPCEKTYFNIDFTPSIIGNITAQITIKSNDPDVPSYNFSVIGEGKEVTLGKLWTRAAILTPFEGRTGMGLIEFNGKLWAIGGYVSPTYKNDIWVSDDGILWTQAVNSANFSGRNNFHLFIFNNKLWICGGTTTSGISLYDLWESNDGMIWTKNYDFAEKPELCFVIYNKIWIINYSTKTFYSSEDGINWNKQVNTGSNIPSGSQIYYYTENNTIYYLSSSSSKSSTNVYTWDTFTTQLLISGYLYLYKGVYVYYNYYYNYNLYYSPSLETQASYYAINSNIYQNVKFFIPFNNKLFLIGKEIWTSE